MKMLLIDSKGFTKMLSQRDDCPDFYMAVQLEVYIHEFFHCDKDMNNFYKENYKKVWFHCTGEKTKTGRYIFRERKA